MFIVGEARSGSTLLYRCLQKHPVFRARTENLAESKLMRSLGDLRAFGPGEPSSAYRFMGRNDDVYSEFLSTIAPLRKVARLGAGVRRRLGSDEVHPRSWFAIGHQLIVRSYFHHARTALGSARLIEKSAGNVSHIDELLRCYPRARLLYIYRHPIDVYTSYLRLARLSDPRFEWARRSVPKFSERWARRTECALDAAERHRGSFLMVRYEDFTNHPTSAAERICAFIGEPFSPDMVAEPEPDLTRRKGSPHLYGEITPVTKEWKDYIDPSDADELQDKLAPVMRRLAYERY